jgi:hypothetical protein
MILYIVNQLLQEQTVLHAYKSRALHCCPPFLYFILTYPTLCPTETDDATVVSTDFVCPL